MATVVTHIPAICPIAWRHYFEFPALDAIRATKRLGRLNIPGFGLNSTVVAHCGGLPTARQFVRRSRNLTPHRKRGTITCFTARCVYSSRKTVSKNEMSKRQIAPPCLWAGNCSSMIAQSSCIRRLRHAGAYGKADMPAEVLSIKLEDCIDVLHRPSASRTHIAMLWCTRHAGQEVLNCPFELAVILPRGILQ